MWELFGVDSLHAYGDYDEGCAFAHAAGIVIESLCRYFGIAGKRVVAHFDEWTTGMGLLYTKWKLPEVATVFTTHATCVGRSICGNGKPLYDYMRGYNGDQMARELNMEAKHLSRRRLHIRPTVSLLSAMLRQSSANNFLKYDPTSHQTDLRITSSPKRRIMIPNASGPVNGY